MLMSFCSVFDDLESNTVRVADWSELSFHRDSSPFIATESEARAAAAESAEKGAFIECEWLSQQTACTFGHANKTDTLLKSRFTAPCSFDKI